MKLTINLEMPDAPNKEKSTSRPVIHRQRLEEKVKEALEKIEMNEDSYEEWEFIRKLNNALQQKKKLGKRAKNILELITPCIEKYGHKSSKKTVDSSDEHSARRGYGDEKSPKHGTEYLIRD